VITLVNVSSKDYSGNIYLPKALYRSKEWRDCMSDTVFKKQFPKSLKLSIEGESLLILKRIR